MGRAALLLLVVGLLGACVAYPSYLTCDRELAVGSEIMFKPAIANAEVATAFTGKACGGTYTPGEQIELSELGGGTYLLQISGARMTSGTCDATRSIASPVTVDTTGATGEIAAWLGRATSGAGPVNVHEKCILKPAAVAVSPPPPVASSPPPTSTGGGGGTTSPTTSPPPAVSPPLPLARPPPPVAKPPPPEADPTVTRACFGPDCKFSLLWSAYATHVVVVVTLEGKNAWVSLGVSRDGTMSSRGAGNLAVVGHYPEGVAKVESYKLLAYTRSDVVYQSEHPGHLERKDGKTTLRLDLNITDSCATTPKAPYILKACRGETILILAYGRSDAFGIHSNYYSLRATTVTSTVNTGEDHEAAAERVLIQQELYWTHIVHICFMFLAWLLLAPIGIFAAMLKHRLQILKEGTPQLWFRLHLRAQLLTCLFTIIGSVFGFLATEQYGIHFSNTHSIAGLITVTLAILQFLNGWFRPGKKSRIRQAWGWTHRGLGYAIFILAIVTAGYGLNNVTRRLSGYTSTVSVDTVDHSSVVAPPPPAVPPVTSPPSPPPPPPPLIFPPPPPPTKEGLLDAVERAAPLIHDIIMEQSVGPLFLRLAWHDAGTYDKNTDKYGPRASMRFSPEADNPSNAGLGRARDLLESVKLAVPTIGYADLYQLAGVVSVAALGGPIIPFRAGRVDAQGPEDCAPPGNLVGPHDSSEDLRRAFNRMGFNDREIVALAGAHSVGMCHMHASGFHGPWTEQPMQFTNDYFQELLHTNFTWDGRQFNNELGTVMMLAADMEMVLDPVFAHWSVAFAGSQSLFFQAFSQSFQKLGELGWTDLYDAPYSLRVPVVITGTVQRAADIIHEMVHRSAVAPTLVRLAWHDAGTYIKAEDKWGPRASMRFEPEANYGANNGLGPARTLMDRVKRAVPELSYSDIWQLAAHVSIEWMGGPKLAYKIGRRDAEGPDECPPDGLLPGGHDHADALRNTFNRMGFDDRAIVSLSGAHTIGRCHIHNSGFDGQWTRTPLVFSNQYFIDITQEPWVFDGDVFRDEDRIMLEPDMQVFEDASMRAWTEAFAGNQQLFFDSFADSFTMLSELGHHNLQRAPYTLTPIEPKRTNAMKDSFCVFQELGECVLHLSWTVHSDHTATMSLTLEQEVRWLALGVSRYGMMVEPPSRAVVADGTSVLKRTLELKKLGDAAATAVVDEIQDLREHSFSRVDGKSVLQFRTDVEWLRQHADPQSGGMWFIYAHGPYGDLNQPLGYHGPAGRGRFQVTAFSLSVTEVSLALNASIQTAAGMIHELVRTRGAGPVFVRLAWHDAGTYNKTDGTGGPRASMRFLPESENPANRGLDTARDMLEPIHSTVPNLGYADLWQLAGIVAIEAMGGPKVPFHVGRVDASSAAEAIGPGRLPGGHDSPEQLRSTFGRMGFDDREIVALLGAHAVGRCHAVYSGFEGPWTLTPLQFTNSYYVDMLNKTFVNDGNQNNADDGTMMLDADLSLIADPIMKGYVEEFAADSDAFFAAFSHAFEKLGTLGWDGLITVPLDIGTGLPREKAIPGTQYLKPGLSLSWEVVNGSVTIELEYNKDVSWMGIGTSRNGRMIDPQSLAVIGDHTGVHRRTLEVKDTLSADHTAPLDEVQDLVAASFVRANGTTTLTFISHEAWLEHHASPEGDLWFIFAHGDPDKAENNPPFGYHGPRRGAVSVNIRGNAPTQPKDYDGTLTLKPGMMLNWIYNGASGVSFWLILEESVEWLALGLSHSGAMVTSLAVVGSSDGVQQRNLVVKDVSSVAATAPLAAQIGIWEESFLNSDGRAVLSFKAEASWLEPFMHDNNEHLFFIWSHARPGDVAHTFSYHGTNRGTARATDFFYPIHTGVVNDNDGDEPVILRAPPAPSGALTGNLALGSVTLKWYVHNGKATITAELDKEAGWFAIAVSKMGWMVLDTTTGEVEPSLAAVATEEGVNEYKLVGQNPQDISRSVEAVANSQLESVGFSRVHGTTKFVFIAPTGWLFTYLSPTGGAVKMLWAHGVEEKSPFGYHGTSRGMFQIPATDFGFVPSPPPSPKPPPPPTATCPPCVIPEVDYCGDIVSYRVGRCYILEDSLIPAQFDDLWREYANRRELAPSFRLAWTIEGGFPDGKISIMVQAKTRGWVGFGLMGGSFGHGMIDTDIWYGNVVDGVANVYDTWSPNIAMPLMDVDYQHTNDITDVGGYEDEENGITTLFFKRKLTSDDDWDHQIVQGEMQVIFAWSANGDDSLSHYHGPARGFETIVLVPHPEFSWAWYIGAGCGVGLLMIIGFYLLDRRRRRTLRQMAEERFNQVRAKVNDTVSKDTPQLSFGMAFVPARDFLALGHLVAHEKLRDIGTLRLVDRFDQAKALVEIAGFKILFFSHQWLAFNEPDPDNTHYNCICLALTSLARNKSIDLDTALVWVDYCSIPQVNKQLQGMAISDLVEYASLATYFIVVVPHAVHADTGEPCNKSTYQERGWCRLEQFAKAATGETSNMFTCSSEPEDIEVKFHPYVAESTEWKRSALGVLHGTFSCCQRTKDHTEADPVHGMMPCDKERLEPALLRIYMAAILRLPQCPLRDQLLSHEELILPSDRFNDDIIRAMHERFDHDLSEAMQVPFAPSKRNLQRASLIPDIPENDRADPDKLLALVKSLQDQLHDRELRLHEAQFSMRYDRSTSRLVTPREADLAHAVHSVLPPLPPKPHLLEQSGRLMHTYEDPDLKPSPFPLKAVPNARAVRAVNQRIDPPDDNATAETLQTSTVSGRHSHPTGSRGSYEGQMPSLMEEVNRKHAERGNSPSFRSQPAFNGSDGRSQTIEVRARASLEPPRPFLGDAYGGKPGTRESGEDMVEEALQRRSLSQIVVSAMAASKSQEGLGSPDSDLEA